MNNKLFDGSDDDNDEFLLTTNENYAKSYNVLRKKELLKKYKDRGLDVSESELDSDSESSEEDEVVDLKFDQEFFKTLASLKSKDPRIYNKDTRFFKDSTDKSDENGEIEQKAEYKKKDVKAKPVTLKDYERQVILEHNGKFESSDEEEPSVQQTRCHSPTAVEEERRLKAEFKKVMLHEEDDEDEEFGGIFKKRSKTQAQVDDEESDFTKWLAGKQADIEEKAKEQLAPLKQYWSNSKLTQGESFLRDYILNKGYANTDASAIPTYDEIVGDKAPLSEDEQELQKQDEFEHKYNFRFEEPDADFIKRYPRTIEQSLRRTDEKRKEKRKELKERKQQEKHQKMHELDLIKELKRKEIEDKIRKLKAVTGNDELGFKDEELEEDFDPAAHDRRMQEIFNEDYYNVDEGEEKPECPSDIEELALEDWDNYDPTRIQGNAGDADRGPHCEDDDFNMDCDFDPATAKQELQNELIENTRSRKGRKGRRNRFMEMIQTEKPVFDPEDEKTYGEYLDQYYQLDYEDIIDDQPCRFKYVETTPNDFGLTIEEILLAKNRELNQWASLKKAVQTRPEHVEKKDQRMYRLKAKNEELKRKIFKSLYGEDSDDDDEESTTVASVDATPTAESTNETEALSKSKKKRLKRKAAAAAATAGQIPTPETARPAKQDEGSDGEVKKPTTAASAETAPTVESTNGTDVLSKSKKKRLKRKAAGQAKVPVAEKVENQANVAMPILPQAVAKLSVKKSLTKPPAAKQAKTIHQGTTASTTEPANNPFKAKSSKAQHSTTKVDSKSTTKPGRGSPTNPFKKGKPFNKSEGCTRNGLGVHKTHSFKAKGGSNSKQSNGLTDERLKAYGINPRKFHKKQRYAQSKH